MQSEIDDGMEQDRDISVLPALAEASGVPVDDLYALYVFFGTDLFLFMYLFEGRKVRFPAEAQLSRIIGAGSRLKGRFIELDRPFIHVNDRVTAVSQVRPGDKVQVKGREYKALHKACTVLNHTYLFVEERDSDPDIGTGS